MSYMGYVSKAESEQNVTKRRGQHKSVDRGTSRDILGSQIFPESDEFVVSFQDLVVAPKSFAPDLRSSVMRLSANCICGFQLGGAIHKQFQCLE